MYVLVSLWFSTLMREFFFNVDKVIYGLIGKIYDLLILIARTSPLSQGDISSMANRIYGLLAVFMIFKVTFSLIMYVVNPDDFTEKSKGVGNLLKNIVLTLTLLILTPFIFRYAFQFQEIILEDNSLGTLIFGNDLGGDSFFASAGEKMQYIAFSPFFVPNKSFTELSECTNLFTEKYYDEDGVTKKEIVFDENCSGLNSENYDPIEDENGKKEVKGLYALTNANGNPNFSLIDLQNYVAGVENSSFGLAYRIDLATATDKNKDRFIMDYSYIASTIVGVVIVLLLINYCMDIAVRSIKLAFLQLIAPIPIISYVDPKSGKDGMFKKWYKMCFSTFVSLFIRLIVIYLAIYIISRIEDGKMVDVVSGSYVTNFYVKVFILIGALMFAKQFPKILEGLGVKLDGGGKFTLNPLKKVSEEAIGGGALKKPAEALGKLPMMPFHAAGTLGRKTIGGIDAARNGKGFKQGWNRTHGNLYNNFHKKLDEWAPDSAETRKNERQGRENLHKINKRYDYGEEVYNRALKTRGGLAAMFSSSEYRRSYNAVNDAKTEMYTAQAKKQADTAEVEERLRRGKINSEEASAAISEINKIAGTAEKKYEFAKAKHDEMKKMHSKDADLEDAYDYYSKLNSAKSSQTVDQIIDIAKQKTNQTVNQPVNQTQN